MREITARPGPVISLAFGPYNSRNAEGIGRRAARKAGNSPPTKPMIRAYDRPMISSCGVTWNANATWLKDETLEDSDSLPEPDMLADEIFEDMQAALALFGTVAKGLKE